LNAKLTKENSSNLFVTIFYSIFDIKSGIMAYANGGHLPILYLSPGGKPEFLDVEEGTPLGLMDGDYSGRKIDFRAGDIFVFYTDGVTEAMNSRGDMYEKERLVKVVEANRTKSAADLVKIIEKDVRKFEPITKQHDDITVIVVKAT
ncbi:MAG TPA: PP2C family protein-serine/threonine phosphatase, partial [Candidatus Omnitrophota bacterium]|nr:PP2C family protein-serine/threonine phosphatase [Candidatus Omnitrophota bacterium]